MSSRALQFEIPSVVSYGRVRLHVVVGSRRSDSVWFRVLRAPGAFIQAQFKRESFDGSCGIRVDVGTDTYEHNPSFTVSGIGRPWFDRFRYIIASELEPSGGGIDGGVAVAACCKFVAILSYVRGGREDPDGNPGTGHVFNLAFHNPETGELHSMGSLELNATHVENRGTHVIELWYSPDCSIVYTISTVAGGGLLIFMDETGERLHVARSRIISGISAQVTADNRVTYSIEGREHSFSLD